MLVITDNNNENTYHLVNHEIMSEIVNKVVLDVTVFMAVSFSASAMS